jgi:dUTP pyrophosphatase
MSITVKMERLDPSLPLPAYAYEGDAAFDLYTAEDRVLAPGERHAFRTGVRYEIPDGYVGLVWDKSSVGIKGGLKTLGGVIDCGYRGELFVGLVNLSGAPYTVSRGEKIAQMLIQRKETVVFEEAPLSESERGDKGFGSSGK